MLGPDLLLAWSRSDCNIFNQLQYCSSVYFYKITKIMDFLVGFVSGFEEGLDRPHYRGSHLTVFGQMVIDLSCANTDCRSYCTLYTVLHAQGGQFL